MTLQISDISEPEVLRFGYGDTALGTIAVAESALGVVALFIGDDRARLLRELKDAFPGAEFVLDQPQAWNRPSPRRRPWSRPPNSGSTCGSICAARRWRSQFGKRCKRFPPARHAATA